MSTHTDDHPLVEWMEKEGLKPYQFADKAEIGRVTIYAVLRGRQPSTPVLLAIEDATGGAITIRQCLEFSERIKRLNQ